MGKLLQLLIEFIQGLLGNKGGSTAGGAADLRTDEPVLCTLPPDLDIPSAVSHEHVPQITTTAQLARFVVTGESAAATFSAQAAGCKGTIRSELGSVNIRSRPSLEFEPPLAKTRGGMEFEIVGVSAVDPDRYRWFNIKLGNGSGWVRSDMIVLSPDCANQDFIIRAGIQVPAEPPPPVARFPLPVKASITQGYSSGRHPGFDMGVNTGYALIAPADGVCIRRIDCTKCTKEKPNRQPNGMLQCPDTWKDPAWGFGYGNFMVLRFDYNKLPQTMRDEMDKQNLKGGFAYMLFAHLSRLNVKVGEDFRKGTALGATGNTGCSTAPHLHFEVRIGKDEMVDNIWAQQRPVHPKLMFEV